MSGSAAIALGADVKTAVSTGSTSPWTPLTAIDAVATTAAAMIQLERAMVINVTPNSRTFVQCKRPSPQLITSR